MFLERLYIRISDRLRSIFSDKNAFKSDKSKPPSHDIWNDLLNKHVMPNGDVNYKSLLRDKPLLEKYLGKLSANPPTDNWGKTEKIAYWINAYNAFTIKLILAHYPVTSIKAIRRKIQIPGINSAWDIPFFEIGGKAFTLNKIEHRILRQMDEPRIHFAINCASGSCPVLRNEAYQSIHLNDQLDDQTREFINDPKKNQLNGTTRLSKIFDWYRDDFGGKKAMMGFIEKYAKNPVNQQNPLYLKYDWDLNEKQQN
jgi:Protein of unknown function, DUF547